MAAAISEILSNTFNEPTETLLCDKPINYKEIFVRQDGDIRQTPEEVGSKREMNQDKKVNLSFEFSANKGVVGLMERLGHRRLYTDGNVTYKKVQTSTIKDSIQLGIQQSVGAMSEMAERDVLMVDFMTVETTSFTSETVKDSEDFTFKTYAPVAFRHFRDLFGIKPDNFVSSFCDSPLSELSNPGASGSVFYLTHDDEYIVKTVQHKEAEFLQKLLPGYYLNLNQNLRTILPKFFGLYCYKCGSKKIRTVVMNNLLPSRLKIYVKYDLKGSTYNRTASKTERVKDSPTFKDLDFIDHHPDGILLESGIYKALVHTIKRDCRVLESFQIMDYSLLLGIHEVDPDDKERIQTDEKGVDEVVNVANGDGQREKSFEDSPNLQFDCDKEIKPTQTSTRTSLFDRNRAFDGLPAKRASGENILLFVGIIDILQSYRLTKRLEHVLKSLVHDGSSISVHNPAFYSQRFQEFMIEKVFKESPSQRLAKRKHEEKKQKGEEEGE